MISLHEEFLLKNSFIDIVKLINDIIREIKNNNMNYDLHKIIIFEDYEFIINPIHPISGKGIYVIEYKNFNLFLDLIQDKVMNNEYLNDKKKDIICNVIHSFKNKKNI